MVSFQSPFPELNQRKIISEPETNTKKRKCDDTDVEEILPFKHWKHSNSNSKPKPTKSFSDIELHLETPMPSEWQRCLDIQSGEIHFYNSRTNKRTLRDPRASSPEPPTPRDCGHHMSLDLELNLPCGSPTSEKANPTTMNKKSSRNSPTTHLFMGSRKNNSSEIMEDDDQGIEMVATVCVRCHMLVMLCKSSPTCPNCKFLHPPYQTSTDQACAAHKLRGTASCHPRNGLVILNLPMRAIWSDDHKGDGSPLPTLS